MKPSAELSRSIEDLRAFDAALMGYLDTLEFKVVSGRNEWRVIDGQEQQSRDCRAELEHAAGAAQLALERADQLRDMPLVRTLEPHNWNAVFREGQRGATDDLRSTVLQAIGALERERTRLHETEKAYFGLAGPLSRFIALPGTVRELVGVADAGGWKPTAATALGVLGQVLITAIATALGTLLFAGLQALFGLL